MVAKPTTRWVAFISLLCGDGCKRIDSEASASVMWYADDYKKNTGLNEAWQQWKCLLKTYMAA